MLINKILPVLKYAKKGIYMSNSARIKLYNQFFTEKAGIQNEHAAKYDGNDNLFI